MAQILIKRGPESALTSDSLATGEFYLCTNNGKLVIQNGETRIELAGKTSVDDLVTIVNTLSGNVGTLNTDVETLNTNVDNINTEMDKKLTTPIGTKGQVLGYTADNTVGAMNIDLSTGNTIYLGTTQPEKQEVNGLWLQEVD